MMEKKPVDLMDRIAKAMEDEKRVGEFKIHTSDKDCKVYIRTVWGSEINAYEPRLKWRLALTQALDELDDIKPGTVPSTEAKE